jgi:hypothetical protein
MCYDDDDDDDDDDDVHNNHHHLQFSDLRNEAPLHNERMHNGKGMYV